MHFVMYAFSNHVGVLHNVTPIDLLAQSVVLSDGVVVKVLNNVTPIDLLSQSAVLFVQTRCVSGGHVSPPLPFA